MNLPGLPGISGMVKVAANQFLVVHDTKSPLESRLGVICIQEDVPNTKRSEFPTGRQTRSAERI